MFHRHLHVTYENSCECITLHYIRMASHMDWCWQITRNAENYDVSTIKTVNPKPLNSQKENLEKE